jgi:RecJ-like exonuclease
MQFPRIFNNSQLKRCFTKQTHACSYAYVLIRDMLFFARYVRDVLQREQFQGSNCVECPYLNCRHDTTIQQWLECSKCSGCTTRMHDKFCDSNIYLWGKNIMQISQISQNTQMALVS